MHFAMIASPRSFVESCGTLTNGKMSESPVHAKWRECRRNFFAPVPTSCDSEPASGSSAANANRLLSSNRTSSRGSAEARLSGFSQSTGNATVAARSGRSFS